MITDVTLKNDELMRLAKDYNLLHLSMHGEFQSINPMFSFLMLRKPSAQDDGRFTAADMFGLPLPKNSLVVLSACETGQVRVTHGNELLGMERALLYAGASTLVLTSWEVHAPSTALWMKTFYREAQTKSPSEAARLALTAVKAQTEYAHPFYWGPFLLTGN
jgi:CHAT domain-containing protein